MMTSSNANIIRATVSLQGESTGDHWIPLTHTNASDAELWCFLLYAWKVKNRFAYSTILLHSSTDRIKNILNEIRESFHHMQSGPKSAVFYA